MNHDAWLERWLPLLQERAKGGIILELGCGEGRDTEVLVRAGHRVIALDLSPDRLAEAGTRAPSAEFHCQDLRAPFPLGGHPASAVIASLSLHYFSWPETLGIVSQIREALVPGGVLLCRLNSTRDDHYGATGHPRISEHYYLVHGTPKRFFDREDTCRLFQQGWSFQSLEEHAIHRYDAPKTVWEAVLERLPEPQEYR